MQLNLKDIVNEYQYHCIAKGFTEKTLKNKMFELERISDYLIEKRGITNLKNINVYDLRSYFRMKQDMGNKATTITAMWKVVHAFFSWCTEEKYLKENPMDAVECPKHQKSDSSIRKSRC